MSSEETESYLSSIEEYVFDEKKIVTYSWLTRTLGLHVNVSKQLLHTFYQNNPKKDELCATYLLIGVSNNGDTNQVLVVKDKDLEEVEGSLKSVTSKHIYSVQKCVEISDLNVLYTAQKEENIDNISKGLSAIDFNCNERDSTLIAKLRFNALPVVSNQPSVSGKKTQPPPPTNKNKSPTKDVKHEQTVKNANSGEGKQSEVKSESEKVVVPSMFKNNPAPKKKAGEKVAAVNNKNSKGIGAFFSKTSKPINEQKTVVDEGKNNKGKEVDSKEKRLSPLKENKATLNICEQSKRNSKTDSSPKEAPAKTKKADSKPSKEPKKSDSKRTGSKKKVTKKADKDEKKRKRLVVLSDSDSSNDSEADEEIQREPTPEPEPTVIPDDDDDIIHGTPEPSRKRKKKLISKTFMTPDGYMVTEKQMVEASGSEDEEGAPEKKLKQSTKDDESLATKIDSTIDSKSAKSDSTEKKVSPKSSNSSPQKTKQSSLMNFFKKK
uniref:DNA polymerase delta subunit 3 n=1 Tax=Cuerna arida TaxID=1464854 RepID=A0A1B6GJL4_9HEMI